MYLKNKNVTTNIAINNSMKISQEEEEIPYTLSEYLMPLIDEENIIKILKNNDYFQETNDIINFVFNEIVYISAFKGITIYDTQDLSNFFLL